MLIFPSAVSVTAFGDPEACGLGRALSSGVRVAWGVLSSKVQLRPMNVLTAGPRPKRPVRRGGGRIVAQRRVSLFCYNRRHVV
jgi:hypothetical protein